MFLRFMVLGDLKLPSLEGGSEVAQEFMADMAGMGLSQIIQSLIWDSGNIFDLVFLLEQSQCDLKL